MADARVPSIVGVEAAEAPAGGGAAGLLICAGGGARVLERVEAIAYPPADAAGPGLRGSEGRLVRGACEWDIGG